MKLDLNDMATNMNNINSSHKLATLAERERRQQNDMVAINRRHINNETTKVEAAKVTIEQFELLKQEIDENRNQSKKSMKIAIISLIVGSATLIVSVVSLFLQIIR